VTTAAAEVVVVGGGPAGLAAATLLARWGHHVVVFSKPTAETPSLGESVPPSTGKLFDVIGVRDRIDAAGFVRATGNTVWWGSHTPRVEYFADGARGWQVTNERLERVLRAVALEAGAAIQETRIEASALDPRQAPFVLDCSGRAGVFARARRLRVHDATYRTIALVGLWRAEMFDVPDPTHTLIESYEGGWAWSVPQSQIERHIAVMVDPRTSALARDDDSRQVYRAELEKTSTLRTLIRRATLVDRPRGWDASMYHASRYVDDNVLLVGDAACFIDPLSSAGVKKALASGWLAAVAVHTSLVKPAMRDIALQFFAAREADVYASFRAMTATFLRDAASGHAHPFWSDRASGAVAGTSTDALAHAFERIRTAPELRTRRNPETRVEPRAAVSGTEVVLEPCLVSDAYPHGLRHVYGHDLVALVELAPAYSSVPELFEAYGRLRGPTALPDFLGALATAIAEKWLVWCDKT
jgi:2-polyprenyl-6-methoxyphenol hydroxylase-like FAD-dependent oxidoreductase